MDFSKKRKLTESEALALWDGLGESGGAEGIGGGGMGAGVEERVETLAVQEGFGGGGVVAEEVGGVVVEEVGGGVAGGVGAGEVPVPPISIEVTFKSTFVQSRPINVNFTITNVPPSLSIDGWWLCDSSKSIQSM